MASTHRIVACHGTHETEIKKSRFICHLFRVASEDDARAQIEAVRKEHWNANHNCTAWIIGDGMTSQRSSDDGEPSGTAGMPMLEVLRRREVTDTLVIVTRYFGGIMLGAGGLIRAYSGAVSEALDTIGIVERVPLSVVNVTANYDDAGRIENAIRARELQSSCSGHGCRKSPTAPMQLQLPASDSLKCPHRHSQRSERDSYAGQERPHSAYRSASLHRHGQMHYCSTGHIRYR
jgi:uncharacterized YigZ family protein